MVEFAQLTSWILVAEHLLKSWPMAFQSFWEMLT